MLISADRIRRPFFLVTGDLSADDSLQMKGGIMKQYLILVAAAFFSGAVVVGASIIARAIEQDPAPESRRFKDMSHGFVLDMDTGDVSQVSNGKLHVMRHPVK